MKVYILTGWNSEYEYEEIEAMSTNKEELESLLWECTYLQEFDLPEDGSLHLLLVSGRFQLVDKEGDVIKDGVKFIH